MKYDKPIEIQKLNELTEEWEPIERGRVHASINKTKADNKYSNAGAIRGKKSLTFKIRYFKELEDISLNLQCYRILYKGVPYSMEDYDDFKEQHREVSIMGVSY